VGTDVGPVCPRHPERVSYVRCQRCARPVCVQCQREAAVGVQCVDCAAAGVAGVRQARTVFGGRSTDGVPYVTYVLMAVSVLVNLLQRVPGLGVTGTFAFVPALAGSDPWRYLTSAFLHNDGPVPFGLLHIGLNMYVLWMLGPYLEQLFGRARFLVVYLLSALGGSVAYLLLVPSTGGGMVGASGAVFGLFGVLVITQKRLNRGLGQIGAVLAFNLVLGFVIAGIAWQAHLGGLAVGLVCALLLAYAPRERRALVQWAGLAAVGVALIAAAALRLVL